MSQANADILAKKKKVLITAALPYVNNVPHLGNLIGAVLSADVFARFCRSYGNEVLFICGTDEYGTTSEQKALQEGVTPQEICEKYAAIHKKVYDWFHCSFDHFGKTRDKGNHDVALHIFKKLEEQGYILEDDLEQMYDPQAKKYLADRFIEGQCPHCQYEDARGDQCDNCGKLLDPTDLINPCSKLTGATPIVHKRKHLFMDLPKIEPELKTWLASVEKNWPKNARSMTQGWLKTGLKPRCISRDLKWGIPIPKEGYTDKVFYSWFDAPIGYIGITKEYCEDWQNWWQSPDTTHLYQFIGKDNIPFHTILFPSFLLGTEENWTLLHHVSSTEYLNYEDTQFSKSRGVGVFGTHAIESGIPADVWRYYLLAVRPEQQDSRFSWEDFQDKSNHELLANLGNFINRTLSFLYKNFDGKITVINQDAHKDFFAKVKEKEETITNLLSTISLKQALQEIMSVSKLGNQFFQEQEPWKVIKEDVLAAQQTLNVCTNLVRKLAILIEPYLPQVSRDIFSQLNLAAQTWQQLDGSLENHTINKPQALFKKYEDKEIQAFKKTYQGTQKAGVELRVAKIKEVLIHPKADKLYILKLDLGDGSRQIISGIRDYHSKEDLLNKHIVVVTNLEPAKLRGEVSEGMLLAADHNDTVVLLELPQATPGIYLTQKQEKKITFNQFKEQNIEVKQQKVFLNNHLLKVDDKEITFNVPDGTKLR